MKSIPVIAVSTLLISFASVSFAQTLHVKKVAAPPVIDGSADAIWQDATPISVSVSPVDMELIKINKEKQKGKYAKNWAKDKHTKISQVQVRAVYTDVEIFFLATWQDETKDDQHKPWKWNKEAKEYETGIEREDRLSFRFPISGEFQPTMLAPVDADVDVWQWKAARTNPGEYIHDKHHLYSPNELKGKFSTHYSPEGKEVYMARVTDGGKSPYSSNDIDPFNHQGDLVPLYIPRTPEDPDGKDVKAKGVWKDNSWTVEIGRKLDTGHKETDAVFNPATGTKMDMAVFDHVGDHFHATSDTITVVFEK